jgi:hypothetical protein
VLVDRTPSQQYMRISTARRNVASGFKRSREVGMSGGAEGQHRFSTGSRNNGKQPASIGRSGHVNGTPDSWVRRPVLSEVNPRNSRSAVRHRYLRSCRAITMRWIWLVPS